MARDDRPPETPGEHAVGHFSQPAYGGEGWSPRTAAHRDEIGTLWADCGIDSEWRPLRAVLLCRPGRELEIAPEAAAGALFSRAPDPARAGAEHDALAALYRAEGVRVIEVGSPAGAQPRPNRMFCADLFAMTPEGAILARPASAVRAGEEVAVAAALAGHGVPILATLTGSATFEGADLIWLDARTAAVGRGLRTDDEAIRQIGALLGRIGVTLLCFDLPFGTMHLMGMIRILDRDLALAWPRRTPHGLVTALGARGVRVAFLPTAALAEAERGRSLNCVTLGPRRVAMPGPNPATRAFLEGLGVAVREVAMRELGLANGAAGCLTGVVARECGG